MLKLNATIFVNSVLDQPIQIQHLLKLNASSIFSSAYDTNSNTTLVKVKFRKCDSKCSEHQIQIQHLLKLNPHREMLSCHCQSIQIQHLLKLNINSVFLKSSSIGIQIQHLLKLNFNKYPSGTETIKFKYNTC